MQLDISFIVPVRHGNDVLKETLTRLSQALLETQKSYEILLVPNHDPSDHDDGTEKLCSQLAFDLPSLRVVPHLGEVGKGAAVKTGMSEAKGRWIFFTDADLPYGVECLFEALKHLEKGADFVTANRRISGSRFVCSVNVLPLVYRRHRYGLLFNKVARVLFGIKTLDTQAGFKGFSSPMVRAILRLQTCSGFLADLEYFLIGMENGFVHKEIPVKFYLYSEKSTVRIFREAKNSITWFSKLWVRRLFGKYRLKSKPVRLPASA